MFTVSVPMHMNLRLSSFVTLRITALVHTVLLTDKFEFESYNYERQLTAVTAADQIKACRPPAGPAAIVHQCPTECERPVKSSCGTQ